MSWTRWWCSIASWYGIGFIDSCYRKCVIYFDVRSGTITPTGTHTCNNIVCNSTGNMISSGSYNLTQTQLSYLSSINSDVQTQLNTITSSYATKSWVQSQGYLVSSSYLPLVGGTLIGLINFNTTITFSTTYTGWVYDMMVLIGMDLVLTQRN